MAAPYVPVIVLSGLQPFAPPPSADATNPNLAYANPTAGPTAYNAWAAANGRFS